jgi:hypothetical protein
VAKFVERRAESKSVSPVILMTGFVSPRHCRGFLWVVRLAVPGSAGLNCRVTGHGSRATNYTADLSCLSRVEPAVSAAESVEGSATEGYYVLYTRCDYVVAEGRILLKKPQ